MRARTAAIFVVLAVASGCSGRTGPRGLASDDAAEKIPAIKRAGEKRDQRAVPKIVVELKNDDPAVRFYAIEALHRITGERLGFVFFEEDSARRVAVNRWEQWAREHPPRPTQK